MSYMTPHPRPGSPESKQLRQSLIEALNRFDNSTIPQAHSFAQCTYADRNVLFSELHEEVLQMTQMEDELKNMSGLKEFITDPPIIDVCDINAEELEEDAKLPSLLATEQFSQAYTSPPQSISKYKCTLCDKTYDRIWTVKRHMIKEHTKLLEKYIEQV